MEARQLLTRIAQGIGPSWPGSAQTRSKIGILNQLSQGPCQGLGIARERQNPAGIVQYLQSPPLSGRDHWKTSLKSFDVSDAEWLRSGVGLAMDVGRGQESRYIGSLTEESNTIGDLQVGGSLLQFFQIASFRWALRPAHKPCCPSGLPTKFSKRLQMKKVAFPPLQSTDLDHNHGSVWCIQLGADLGSL